MKALVGAFNEEKALVGAFSVITIRTFGWTFVSSSTADTEERIQSSQCATSQAGAGAGAGPGTSCSHLAVVAGPGKRGQWSPAAASSRETEGVLAVFMLSRLRLPGHLLLSLINYISFRSPFPTRISHLCGHTFPCCAHRAFPALGG